jgi:hypothetical protein
MTSSIKHVRKVNAANEVCQFQTSRLQHLVFGGPTEERGMLAAGNLFNSS